MDYAEFSPGDTTVALAVNTDLQRLITVPAYWRGFYGNLQDILTTSFNSTYMTYWVDYYNSLLSQNGQNILDMNAWIAARASYAQSQLAIICPAVTYAITGHDGISNGGANFSVNSNQTTLTGNAWINVNEISPQRQQPTPDGHLDRRQHVEHHPAPGVGGQHADAAGLQLRRAAGGHGLGHRHFHGHAQPSATVPADHAAQRRSLAAHRSRTERGLHRQQLLRVHRVDQHQHHADARPARGAVHDGRDVQLHHFQQHPQYGPGRADPGGAEPGRLPRALWTGPERRRRLQRQAE